MIPMDQLTTLQPAATVVAVSTEAEKKHVEASIAYNINYAANCGQKEVLWQHKLTTDMQEMLKAQGYKIRQQKNSAHGDRLWVISWE